MTGRSSLLGKFRERFRGLSLRRRVGLLAGVGVGLLVVVMAATTYVTVRMSMSSQLDTTLLERAYAADDGPLTNPEVLKELPAEAMGAGDVQVALLYAGGQALSTEGEESAPPMGRAELEVAAGRAENSVRTLIDSYGHEHRVVAVPVSAGVALVMGQSLDRTQKVLDRLGLVLFVVGGAGVVLAGWSGYEIGRVGLRPVQRLTAAAEHVARTGDLRPVPVQGNDELGRLAHSFNAMLTALAEARGRERRLIADAGHELRTPLTSLRTNLDLLVQSEGRPGLSPEDRAGLLDDVRAQIVELSALVGDLVELSRGEEPAESRVPLDLGDVTTQAVERVRRRAPAVRLDTDIQPMMVIGDHQTLERAVTNLLDNAAKWSPPGGVVTVRLAGGVLTITDQGPGIADADLPHVFDRFYRSAEARTMPGSGLGLAIVKQAAERHGGYVRAAHGPGGRGAQFVFGIPGIRQPASGSSSEALG